MRQLAGLSCRAPSRMPVGCYQLQSVCRKRVSCVSRAASRFSVAGGWSLRTDLAFDSSTFATAVFGSERACTQFCSQKASSHAVDILDLTIIEVSKSLFRKSTTPAFFHENHPEVDCGLCASVWLQQLGQWDTTHDLMILKRLNVDLVQLEYEPFSRCT